MSLTDNEKMQVGAMQRLMEAQTTFNLEMGMCFGTVSGLMLRLRSHERGVEKHDDVTKVIMRELIPCVTKSLKRMINMLDDVKPGNCTTTEQGLALADKLMLHGFGDEAGAVLSKYVVGFTAPIARALLMASPKHMGERMDSVACAGAALLASAGYAKAIDAIDNENEVEVVSGQLESICEHVAAWLTDSSDKACEALDRIAEYENEMYVKLLGEGKTMDEALRLVNEAVGPKILVALKEDGNEAT